MPNHPYRDEKPEMSPMYFDTDSVNGLSFALDLREVRYIESYTDGNWVIYWRNHGEARGFDPETGARIYNALRAYHQQ